MSPLHAYAVLTVMQATLITLIAAFSIRLAKQNPALRHTIASVALGLVILSPVTARILPSRTNLAGWNESSSAVETSSRAFPTTSPTALSEHAIKDQQSIAVTNSPSRDVSLANITEPSQTLSRDPVAESSPDMAASSSLDSHHPASGNPADQPTTAWGVAAVLNAGLVLWLCGVGLLTVRLIRRLHRLNVLGKTFRPAQISGREQNVLDCVRQSLNTDWLPPIYESRSIGSPIVLGLFKPKIVLPDGMMNSSDPDELASVLIHECAHVIRFDPWVHAAQHLVRVIWWYHPAVHLVSRELSQSREELCDNHVLQNTAATQFAQTLLDLSRRDHGPHYALSLLGIFNRFGDSWTLESRVAGLLDPDRRSAVRTSIVTRAVIAGFFLAMVCLMGGSRTAAQKGGDENDSQATNVMVIRGKCLDSRTSTPVAAEVRLYQALTFSKPATLVAKMQTDVNGAFEFADVPVPQPDESGYVQQRLTLVALADQHATGVTSVTFDSDDQDVVTNVNLSDSPASIFGRVTDSYGDPVSGATVFCPSASAHPIEGIRTAITDREGNFEIKDLSSWDQFATLDKSKETFSIRTAYFYVRHPDYPQTKGQYTKVPQQVDLTLHPAAVVEGRVVDLVTGKPIGGLTVSAQGVGTSDWFQTQTDPRGHYVLRLTEDHFNIWAEQQGRMPLAIKALKAEPGKRTTGHDIHMTRGGYVSGFCTTGSGEILQATKFSTPCIAHYGPARPRTGAAVTSTPIGKDGSFRLHVAPGKNYIYLMGGQASAWVNVGDGEEVKLNLVSGQHLGKELADDSDRYLRGRIVREARERQKKAESNRFQSDQTATQNPNGDDRLPRPEAATLRRDTKAGKRLTELDDLNHGSDALTEKWSTALYRLARLDADSVPELIDELDRTDDDMMLRCLGFSLRAIGDKRAVPALIRAIPRTHRPSGSDYGLRAGDNEVIQNFLKRNDLDQDDHGYQYSFGRPVREIYGALHALTGENFGDDELFHVFSKGTPRQHAIQRELFQKNASKWAAWWEKNWDQHVTDQRYARVGLRVVEPSPTPPVALDQVFQSDYSTSNHLLEPIDRADDQSWVAYDLDTGRYARLPQRWRGRSLSNRDRDAIIEWATNEGFDLLGDTYKDSEGNNTFAMRGIGLQAWELGKEDWKNNQSLWNLIKLQSRGRKLSDSWLIATDPETATPRPKAHFPMLYVTAEGTAGLLFVGIPIDQVKHVDPKAPDDNELNPFAFDKGRKFGFESLVPYR